jgi:hypothetical protein
VPLIGPNTEDQRKLHAEINQIVNQRFIVITAAITLFGVVFAWMLQKLPSKAGDPLGFFPFVLSVVLSLLLFGLYIVNHILKGTLRIISSYLGETRASNWELDWIEFRRENYFGYTKAQTVIFLILNLFALISPLLLVGVWAFVQSRPQDDRSVL